MNCCKKSRITGTGNSYHGDGEFDTPTFCNGVEDKMEYVVLHFLIPDCNYSAKLFLGSLRSKL